MRVFLGKNMDEFYNLTTKLVAYVNLSNLKILTKRARTLLNAYTNDETIV